MSMFLAPAASASGEFNLLEDGCYEAVCVGLRGFMGTKYQSDQPEPKMQFVFQVQDDEGRLHYLTTKPLTNTINDKSNLFKVLNGLTGYGLDKFPVGFDYRVLVNAEKTLKCQLTIKTVASKKDPTKQFNEIDGYLKAKKGQKTTFVADDKAPAWLNQNVIETCWMPGLGFQEQKVQFGAPTEQKPQFIPTNTTQVNAGDFLGQSPMQQACGTNVAPSECAVAPFPTAQEVAQTPATQPSAYVAPQPKQTYVPPAAPAPQPTWPAPQNPVVEVDDGDSLPF
ncbi:hypothetical protein [Fibrobacter sp. UWP2]|uniref:hypothetical protein n=1 Tax=Fibrobacter sp. UWP2 TaxID=1896216 RepID=UPI0009163640|nr:hypothetical protein [Fibrobacter sp. UWP2]SHI34852.1 hypothetical protein SAMN05720471_101244 [Fibrobacter sp. UWP2]